MPAYVQACNCCKISLILSAIVKRKAYRQALVCGIETEEKERHRRRYHHHHHHHYIAYNLKSIRHSFFFFVIKVNVKVAKKQKKCTFKIYDRTNERMWKKVTVFVLEKDFINFVAFFSCVLLFYWKVWSEEQICWLHSIEKYRRVIWHSHIRSNTRTHLKDRTRQRDCERGRYRLIKAVLVDSCYMVLRACAYSSVASARKKSIDYTSLNVRVPFVPIATPFTFAKVKYCTAERRQ